MWTMIANDIWYVILHVRNLTPLFSFPAEDHIASKCRKIQNYVERYRDQIQDPQTSVPRCARKFFKHDGAWERLQASGM